IHWTHLARVAHLHAHHGRNRARDGAVPGGVAEGDDGGGDGQRRRDPGLWGTGPAQKECGQNRDRNVRVRVGTGLRPVQAGQSPATTQRLLSLRDNIYSWRKKLPPPQSTRGPPSNSRCEEPRACKAVTLGFTARTLSGRMTSHPVRLSASTILGENSSAPRSTVLPRRSPSA